MITLRDDNSIASSSYFSFEEEYEAENPSRVSVSSSFHRFVILTYNVGVLNNPARLTTYKNL